MDFCFIYTIDWQKVKILIKLWHNEEIYKTYQTMRLIIFRLFVASSALLLIEIFVQYTIKYSSSKVLSLLQPSIGFY